MNLFSFSYLLSFSPLALIPHLWHNFLPRFAVSSSFPLLFLPSNLNSLALSSCFSTMYLFIHSFFTLILCHFYLPSFEYRGICSCVSLYIPPPHKGPQSLFFVIQVVYNSWKWLLYTVNTGWYCYIALRLLQQIKTHGSHAKMLSELWNWVIECNWL